MKIKVTSDSTCDLSPEIIEENGITQIALAIIKDGQTFNDSIDIMPADIFAHVAAGGSMCSTTAVNIGEYISFFKPFAEQYDALIHVTLGAGFSSCYQNAKTAAQEFDNVFVIDSANLSSGQGHVVLETCRMAEKCETMDDVRAGVEMIRELTTRVEASFLLNRLDYMVKGGRCSAVAALGANLLQLKPCIEVRNGKMQVCRRYRGKYDKCLADYVRDRLDNRDDIIRDRLFVTYTPVQDNELEAVMEAVESCPPFKTVYQTHAGCTVSCHCGPGTLGVLFIRNK